MSAMSGAIDGFDHIQIIGKREKVHISGEHAAEDNVWIDEDFFKGKRILLIDDICTSGRTSDAFKERMESAGAHVRMAMFLAKTKNYRRFEHPRQTGRRRKPKGQEKARTLSRCRKSGGR